MKKYNDLYIKFHATYNFEYDCLLLKAYEAVLFSKFKCTSIKIKFPDIFYSALNLQVFFSVLK